MQNKAAVQLLTQSQVSQSIREGSIPSEVQSRLAASRCWHGAPVEISTFGEDRIGVISYCSPSFHSYHSYWAKDLLCVLQAEIKGTGPGPVFLRCT